MVLKLPGLRNLCEALQSLRTKNNFGLQPNTYFCPLLLFDTFQKCVSHIDEFDSVVNSYKFRNCVNTVVNTTFKCMSTKS